jgi:hypothetical protein
MARLQLRQFSLRLTHVIIVGVMSGEKIVRAVSASDRVVPGA